MVKTSGYADVFHHIEDLEREVRALQELVAAWQQSAVTAEEQRDHARAWCGCWQLLACRMPTDHLCGTLVNVASDGWDGYLARYSGHE